MQATWLDQWVSCAIDGDSCLVRNVQRNNRRVAKSLRLVNVRQRKGKPPLSVNATEHKNTQQHGLLALWK